MPSALVSDPAFDRREFRARVVRSGTRVNIPLPFEPATAWGPRDRYHVTGTVDGRRFRGPLVFRDGSWSIQGGPSSSISARVIDGAEVAVEIWPEGPQVSELPDDIAQALAGRPAALSAFEALAQFYRRGWLRWIESTKRRPHVRAERIAEMLEQLEAGHKERR